MARSRGSKTTFVSFGGAVALLALLLIFSAFFAPYVRALKANFFSPHATNSELSTLSKDALIARVQADEDMLSKVKYQSVLYGLLVEENAALKKILRAAPAPNTITVRVLAEPSATLYDTFLVDQGSATGVAEGDLAKFSDVALGRVVSVSAHTALVSLFSSPGTKTDVHVGNPQAIAIAEGKGGGAFELSVPQGVVVAAGDAVRMSTSQTLLLGTVVRVVAKPTDASQTVYVRSPASFADFDFIELVPNL